MSIISHVCATLGLATSSILLPKTARHHKLWDSMASSRVLSHTTSITSGKSIVLPLTSSELTTAPRWQPFDSVRNWPDLGPRFIKGERIARTIAGAIDEDGEWIDKVSDDKRDLDWSTVLKRTFEAFIRGETPNLYGEHIAW